MYGIVYKLFLYPIGMQIFQIIIDVEYLLKYLPILNTKYW